MPGRENAAGVDLAGLDLRDALDLAILVEEEARERYLELADQMEKHRSPEAAGFFSVMARNEKRHEDELRARRQQLFADAPRRMTRAMLWDVEAPDYDEVRAFITARHAMEIALRCETKAHDFFVAAIPHVRNAEVAQLFEDLRNEEVVHQALVREAMAALPPEPSRNPGDYEDEPVGH